MKSTTKKIFFVLSAGWGPVMRALPVANALKNLGLKTYFHVSGKIAIKTMSDAGHEFATPKSFPQTGNPKRDWWTLDQLLFDFGWNDQNFVESRFAAYYDVIKSIKPDVMIVDFNSTAMLVARVLKIPTVAIVHSCFHPQRKSPYIVWWKEPPSRIPTITPVINKILRKYGVNVVSCAEELQIGDITVIPSFPEFEPLSVVDEKTYYVGPIFDNKKNVKKK